MHHRLDTFDTLEWALRWADPWSERIGEEPSDAGETAVWISIRRRPGALCELHTLLLLKKLRSFRFEYHHPIKSEKNWHQIGIFVNDLGTGPSER